MLLDFSTFTSFSSCNITNVGTSTCSCNVQYTTEGLLETYLEKKGEFLYSTLSTSLKEKITSFVTI